MFDFSVQRPPVWPEHLKPKGENTADKESFEEWWDKHEAELAHLHPQIAEQWVHRHWYHSEFAFIPLDTMGWKKVSMEGEEILQAVKRELVRTLDPEFDYKAFQGRYRQEKLPTATALDSGTWDYPIIALSTPKGWLSRRIENHQSTIVEIDEYFMLIEGHQRFRYLNALHHLDMAPDGPHDVFIINSPITD